MYDPLDIAIGAELRRIRSKQNMSQDELSSRIGKAATTISEHERGKISMTMPTFISYCKALGADPAKVVAAAYANLGKPSAN